MRTTEHWNETVKPAEAAGEISNHGNVVRTGCEKFSQDVSRAIINPVIHPTSGQEDE